MHLTQKSIWVKLHCTRVYMFINKKEVLQKSYNFLNNKTQIKTIYQHYVGMSETKHRQLKQDLDLKLCR
jgi:hypothetical protein